MQDFANKTQNKIIFITGLSVNIAVNQIAFHQMFLGCLMEKKQSNGPAQKTVDNNFMPISFKVEEISFI